METSTPPPSSSSSCQSCIIQSLAVLIGIVFVAVTVAILMAIPIEAQLFNPNIYKRAVASQDLYERLPSLLATTQSTTSDNSENDARYLTPADKEVIFKEVLSPEISRSLLETIIDQTLAYYNSTDPNAKIQISMVDLKARLEGESGDRIMRQIISSWPSCTEAQNQAWRDTMAGTGEMPKCSPSQNVLAEATPKLGDAFDEMVSSIPDVGDLTPKYIPTPGATSTDPRPTLMIIRWIVKLSPLISVLLLVLITLLVVRSWKGFLGWWGALFLIVGIITFMMAALSGVMVESMISRMSVDVTAQGESGGGLVITFVRIVGYVLRDTGIRITILAALSGLLGLGMVIFAAVLGSGKTATNAPSDPYATLPR